MKKIVSYHLVAGEDSYELETKVIALLSRGYQPYKELYSWNGILYREMVIYEEET